MSIERITVGTDFSDTSSTALRYAADVSTKTGIRMRVVHAYMRMTDYYYPAELPFTVRQDQEDEIRVGCEHSLREQLKKVGCDPSDVDVDVEPGLAHHVLLEGNQEEDLLVVGHDHRRALARAFAGSVATRVVRRAKGPVLALPPTAGPGTPKRILVCDDFSEQASRVPETLAALSLLDDAEVELVYVVEDPLEPLFVGAEDVGEGAENRREALARGFREMLDERIKAYQSQFPGKWEASVLRGARASEALLDHSASTRAQLVAIASTGKGAVERALLGSTAEALLHKTNVPLLVSH